MRAQRLPRILGVLCLATLAGASSVGCIAVAAGAAYGAYKVGRNGESRSYHAPLERTWHASLATMREYGYPIENAPLGPGGGKVSMNGLSVDVTSQSPDTTVVTVTQGTFDTASHRVTETVFLDTIGKKLGVSP